MKKLLILAVTLAVGTATYDISARHDATPRTDVPRDSILLSDPCVLADEATSTYYMTGTGGKLWKSTDLEMWSGPYDMLEPDTTSWMGAHPAVWAAELHKYNGHYYCFATFTNDSIIVSHNHNGVIPRRASHIFVSDQPDGPYRPAGSADYLPADRPTLDGTFWVDTDGKPYMVFCGEWLANDNGTMEKIQLAGDLSAAAGEPSLMFRASDSPWSREQRDGGVFFNRVTDGPWLFRTATGRLGMIWTSWVFSDYTTGVAYSESGTLDGPWVQVPEPVLPPDYGHGMIFRDFGGRFLLSAHSHKDVSGRYIRRPTLWEVDLSGDSLRIGRQIGK